ncbi:MAG: hypothetical protein WC881_05575, partial [Elusimicrobiota bacterium]
MRPDKKLLELILRRLAAPLYEQIEGMRAELAQTKVYKDRVTAIINNLQDALFVTDGDGVIR